MLKNPPQATGNNTNTCCGSPATPTYRWCAGSSLRQQSAAQNVSALNGDIPVSRLIRSVRSILTKL